MEITSYSEINPLIDELLGNIYSILGGKLVGLYLHGSLVSGDFDPRSSDIDLLAALSSDINNPEFEQLEQMHADFARQHSQWDDRIEVCYISTGALKTIKSHTSQVVNISPGEPIHRLEAGKEWIIKWYQARERSKTLFGPLPESIIEPITKDEYIQCVMDHVRNWDRWLQDMPHNRYALSYAILTMCRALYSCKTGDQASKKEAAAWAAQEIPAWSGLIKQAILWKKAGRDPELDEVGFQKTAGFVDYVRKLIMDA